METDQQNKAITKSNSDKKKVQQILKGFDQEKSEAVIYLKKKYGDLKQYEYLQIAEYCAKKNNILTLDRESKRRKEVLLKWYHDNFHILKPILDNIVLENEDHDFFGEKADILKREKKLGNSLKEETNTQNKAMKEETFNVNLSEGEKNSQNDTLFTMNYC